MDSPHSRNDLLGLDTADERIQQSRDLVCDLCLVGQVLGHHVCPHSYGHELLHVVDDVEGHERWTEGGMIMVAVVDGQARADAPKTPVPDALTEEDIGMTEVGVCRLGREVRFPPRLHPVDGVGQILGVVQVTREVHRPVPQGVSAQDGRPPPSPHLPHSLGDALGHGVVRSKEALKKAAGLHEWLLIGPNDLPSAADKDTVGGGTLDAVEKDWLGTQDLDAGARINLLYRTGCVRQLRRQLFRVPL